MRLLTKQVLIAIYIILIVISLFLIFIPSFSSLGQSSFVGLILISFTYYFTQEVFEYNKQTRWNKINKMVTSELNEEFSEILTDIALICGFNEIITFDHEKSNEEISKIFDKQIIDKLEKHTKNKDIKVITEYKEILLEGGFGDLFEKREKYLNQFQIKYLDYLEPIVIIILIGVQKALHRIDQQITIRKKSVENKWLRPCTDEQVLFIIEKNFQIILDGIKIIKDKGILKYH